MNIKFESNSNNGQTPGGRFPTEPGYSGLNENKIDVSSVLKDKILIAQELARQCFGNIQNKKEAEKNDIIFEAKREIISWQAENGLTGEEIEKIISAFNDELQRKIEISENISAGLDSLSSAIEQKNKVGKDGTRDGQNIQH